MRHPHLESRLASPAASTIRERETEVHDAEDHIQDADEYEKATANRVRIKSKDSPADERDSYSESNQPVFHVRTRKRKLGRQVVAHRDTTRRSNASRHALHVARDDRDSQTNSISGVNEPSKSSMNVAPHHIVVVISDDGLLLSLTMCRIPGADPTTTSERPKNPHPLATPLIIDLVAPLD
jgi:hypothetical protein